MNTGELTRLLEEYNRKQLAGGWALVVLSLFLWAASYGIAMLFVYLISIVIFRTTPTAMVLHGSAGAVMVVLLIDAVRCQRELFDLERFADLFYSTGANTYHISVSSDGVSVTRGNFLQAAWGISEFLLCAPRCMIGGLRRLRSRVRIDAGMVIAAVKGFTQLARTRDWVDVTMFGQEAPSLNYLDVTDLVWTRVDQGAAQVKLAADARAKYLVA